MVFVVDSDDKREGGGDIAVVLFILRSRQLSVMHVYIITHIYVINRWLFIFEFDDSVHLLVS